MMMVSINMKSFYKIPKLLIGLCIVFTIIPGFLARLDMYYIDDMIWFLLLLPCYIFSYYLGFSGGLLTAVTVNIYHLFWYIYEKYIRLAEMIDVELSLHVGVAVVTFLCSVGVGLLSEKLTEKQVQLQALNRKLEHLALYDALTNLPNRRYFMEKLSESMLDKEPVFLLFIDLDGFKKVNDTLGHEEGDRLLQVAANRLQSFTSNSAFASRLGGDEFIVMVTGAAACGNVKSLAANILNALRMDVNGMKVSASIGMAASQPGDTPSTLLKNADTAMYHVKSKGKNAVG
ncbi:GGDEF domain-containing protein [Neobacillus mesonae]|uniref:GGDEF domain-containing protein n=1 Tax=Neobacillus mesonae TaxID=1193713 RepID=UPI00203CDB90|nr:GGDEF domain-containing protein [Neobacillus mesonae]MCM3570576.1 GGDEF domain-containing protein [Neobacillus mesonae]